MKTLILFLIIYLPFTGYTQPVQFTKDLIPTVNGKVVFNVDFDYDLSKEEFRERTRFYLDSVLNPYSGDFYGDNDDYTTCRITDYIEIEASIFQVLGMYMSYRLQLNYKDGICKMTINDITYMEKRYFELNERSQDDLHMPEYSGKDIMIDEKYTVMLKRKASERIRDESLKRINEVIANLDALFTKE